MDNSFKVISFDSFSQIWAKVKNTNGTKHMVPFDDLLNVVK